MKRLGNRNRDFFQMVVIDGRTRRDGRALDLLGYYDPESDPVAVKIDSEKAKLWLRQGALPSESARQLLFKAGIITSLRGKKIEIADA